MTKFLHLFLGAGLTVTYLTANQVLALVGAFLVVRTLAPADYAIYSIAVAVLGMIGSLCDAGVSASLSSALGKVWKQTEMLASAVKTAMHLRHLFFVTFIPFITGIFFWMSWEKTTLLTQFLIAVIIVYTAYLTLAGTLFSIVPLFTGKQAAGQFANFLGSGTRIVLLGLLCVCGLGQTIFYLIAGLLAAYVSYVCVKKIIPYKKISQSTRDESFQKEMMSVAKKSMPNVVFYAVQGQLTVLLIAIFGNGQAVAEVGALGRVAMAYAFLASIFGVYGPPRFAKITDHLDLKLVFIKTLTVFVIPVLGGSLLLTIYPNAFLIFLGPQYEDLSAGLIIVVWTLAMTTIAGAIWAMLAARALVSLVWLYIPVTVTVQAMALLLFDVSALHGVLMFGLVTAFGSLLLNLFQAWRLIK